MTPIVSTSFFFVILLLLCSLCFGAPTSKDYRRNHYDPKQLKRRFDGRATWFVPDTGACGDKNVKSDYIVAMNSHQYQGGGPCHKTVHIKNESNGKDVSAVVTDECPSCDYGSLDLSPSVFKELGDLDAGVLPISWHFE